jgi:uncharacterized protein YkwD
VRVALLLLAVLALANCSPTLQGVASSGATSPSGGTSISDLVGGSSQTTSTSGSSIAASAPDHDPFKGLINTARSAVSLSPLAAEQRLTIAAQTHANDMSDNSYFSHTDLDGGSVATRVTETGYDWCWVGENIAYGYSTQASVFQAWMDSPGHKANMLSANPTEFGLGHASTGNYWVLVLAKPGC